MTGNVFRLAAATLALSLASGPIVAQEAFGDWDANTDSGVDVTEFETGLGEAGLFSRWDTDADGSLSQDELDTALGDRDLDFSAWDGDGDGVLRESELLSGLFSAHDADASGNLDEEEFGAFESEDF